MEDFNQRLQLNALKNDAQQWVSYHIITFSLSGINHEMTDGIYFIKI